MGAQFCCVATQEIQRKEETEMLSLARQPTSSPGKRPLKDVTQSEFMNKIVSDATKRVKQLKRQRTQLIDHKFSDEDGDDDSNEGTFKFPNHMKGHGKEDADKIFDLSSIMGEGLEWSPKASPKQKKKRGFVKLSSYESAAFSTANLNKGVAA